MEDTGAVEGTGEGTTGGGTVGAVGTVGTAETAITPEEEGTADTQAADMVVIQGVGIKAEVGYYLP